MQALKQGERNFFKLLDVPEEVFEDMPFEELLKMENEVLYGMNRVQKYDDIYFDVFERALVKHFDNGEMRLEFYARTNDAEEVFAISQVIEEHFRDEIVKGHDTIPFGDHPQYIIDIANGVPDPPDTYVEMWEYGGLEFGLRFSNRPIHIFDMRITMKPEIVVDYSVRRKGTILDLLDFDINLILAIGELCEVEIIDDPEEVEPEEGDFVDYYYLLDKIQLGLFDLVKIRIYNQEKKFREDVHTNITLGSTEPIDINDIVRLADKLYELYGKDNLGKAQVDYTDRQMYDMFGMFTGRGWTFNHYHGIYDVENEDEEVCYDIDINNMNDLPGFTLSIVRYNALVAKFGQG